MAGVNKKREAKQRQREAEQRQREAEQRQELKELKEIKIRNEKQIDIEFSVLQAEGNSFKKAKHILLRKYHPDKNKENTANEMTQYINNIVNK